MRIFRAFAMMITGVHAAATLADGPAQSQSPTVTYQAAPILITGAGDDEAQLFALPRNAPPTLVAQRSKIEDLRLRLQAQRTKLMELVQTFDFDEPAANQQSLVEAIEISKLKVQELEDLEAQYVLDKELYVADNRDAESLAPAH